MISVLALTLVSFQLGNPSVSSMLPNTMICLFEKTEEFREAYEVSPGTKLQVINVNGDIELKKWDKDYVEVHATKKTNRDRDELAKVRVEVVTGDELEIRTEYLEKNAHVSVDYRVRVPGHVVVQKVSTSNGDIELKETKGDTKVMTSNGDVDLKDVVGILQVQTANGDIDIRGATVIIEARTSNGDILAQIRQILDGGVEIATSNGSIDLFVSGKLNADLNCTTSMGEVSIDDIGLQSRFTTRTGSSVQLRGLIGKGGALIRVQTSNGDIRLKGLGE
jgi:DUF4097 and DUF4098 domain-containing protein YvlB